MSPTGIHDLSSLGQYASFAPARGAAAAPQQNKAESGLGGFFSGAAAEVRQLETNAQTAVSGLLTGQGVEVHDAIIATQKSELAFELALQVRNKAVSAYQQMMQMQF